MGAVAPSSARLCDRLAAIVPGSGDPVVVELGAGTGPTTAAVQRRLRGRGQHVAVELDPVLADRLERTYPDVDVAVGDAADLGRILAERGLSRVDAVLSGLPWSLIPPEAQRAILEAVADALRPEAAFTTIAYLNALPLDGARGFRALLGTLFDEVLTTRTVWANIPPAVTYVCRRPAVR